jgi:hypothetical protein
VYSLPLSEKVFSPGSTTCALAARAKTMYSIKTTFQFNKKSMILVFIKETFPDSLYPAIFYSIITAN